MLKIGDKVVVIDKTLESYGMTGVIARYDSDNDSWFCWIAQGKDMSEWYSETQEEIQLLQVENNNKSCEDAVRDLMFQFGSKDLLLEEIQRKVNQIVIILEN